MYTTLSNPFRRSTGQTEQPDQPQPHAVAGLVKTLSMPDTQAEQLTVALQLNDRLLRDSSVLAQKVSLLELELANVRQLAHFDLLTGLPNRRLLLDRFSQAKALADRHCQQLAVLFLDIDDFKGVNDKLGHDAGDKLLQEVGRRLNRSVRESDTVCRYGGDEFVILLTEIDSHEQAVKILQKVRTNLAPTFIVDHYSIQIALSDGLAIYPDDAHSLAGLMQLADRTMLSKKSDSRLWSASAPTSTVSFHKVDN